MKKINLDLDDLIAATYAIDQIRVQTGELTSQMDAVINALKNYQQFNSIKDKITNAKPKISTVVSNLQKCATFMSNSLNTYYEAYQQSCYVNKMVGQQMVGEKKAIMTSQLQGFTGEISPEEESKNYSSGSWGNASAEAYAGDGKAGASAHASVFEGEAHFEHGDLTGDASMTFLSADVEASAEVDKEAMAVSAHASASVAVFTGHAELNIGLLNVSADATVLGANASADASAGLFSRDSSGNLYFDPHAEFELQAAAYVFKGEASTFFGNDDYGIGASGDVTFLEANAGIKGEIDLTHIKVGAEANAIVVDANASIDGKIGGYKIGCGTGATVGLDASFKIEAGIDMKEWKVDLGAALGVGFKLSLTLPNPILLAADLAGHVVNAVQAASKAVVQAFETAGNYIKETATKVVNWFKKW